MLFGSALGLYNALIDLGKKAEVIVPEYPAIYNFLPNADKMQKEGTREIYDLAIAVDSSDVKRLNGFAGYFEQAKTTINIDHHSVNSMFADYNFVNPDSPACCQILILVLEYLGVTITKEIGSCLVTGIITDTGGFKYAGTSKETFEFTAWLLSIAGVVILSVLAEFVLPEGQMNRYTKVIFSFVILLVIIMPLPKLLGKEFDISKFFGGANDTLQEDYLEQVNLDKLNAMSESVNIQIKESGLLNVVVSINGNIFSENLEIYSILVDLRELEYATSFGSKDKTKAKAKILQIIGEFPLLKGVEVKYNE